MIDNVDNNNNDKLLLTKNNKTKAKTKAKTKIKTLSTSSISSSSTTKNNNSNNPLSNFPRYTKGLTKNKSLKILDNVKIHNYWGNIYRRKAQMHSYFSESAFGSQADTKIEYRNLWEDPEYLKKYSLTTKTIDNDDEKE